MAALTTEVTLKRDKAFFAYHMFFDKSTGSYRRRNHPCQILWQSVQGFLWQSVQGFWSSDTPNFALLHRNSWSPLQQCKHYRATLWFTSASLACDLTLGPTILYYFSMQPLAPIVFVIQVAYMCDLLWHTWAGKSDVTQRLSPYLLCFTPCCVSLLECLSRERIVIVPPDVT